MNSTKDFKPGIEFSTALVKKYVIYLVKGWYFFVRFSALRIGIWPKLSSNTRKSKVCIAFRRFIFFKAKLQNKISNSFAKSNPKGIVDIYLNV